MTALGVWACRWRELRPIEFGGGKGRRGGGGDEAGGYRMVGMDGGEEG